MKKAADKDREEAEEELPSKVHETKWFGSGNSVKNSLKNSIQSH